MKENYERKALEEYIEYTSQFTHLNEEEQRTILNEYEKTKDDQLKEKLFESNTRLVTKIACELRSRYKNFLSTLELISEGNLGLLHSIQNYSSEKCKRTFANYAGECIKGYIKRAITKIEKIRKREENLEEICFPIEEDGLGNPLKSLIKKDQKELANYLIDKLSGARREVTIKYYILEKTLDEIGEEMGRTHQAISKRLKRSIEQMRTYLKK